ncbi:MAG: VOC family protein [Candidatus Eremiobacteraeota bacterium]|nr:VOC family protein [Candidatus Eremiobacteraeota bacterium]
MGSPVVHFEIVGQDPKRLRSFYKDAFDWEIGSAAPGAGIADYTIVKPIGDRRPEPPGMSIDGGIGKAPEGYSGHVTFYVAVDDANAALRKIESLGGKKMMGPEQVPNGPVIALFEDPEGHVVGLVEP